MNRAEIKKATQELMEEVLASYEFYEFKREIECRQKQNWKPRKESRFILSIAGKLVDEAEEFSNIVGLDWTEELTEAIDDYVADYLSKVYNTKILEELYESYDPDDFMDIDEVYENLSNKVTIEITAKADPNEHYLKRNNKDVITKVFNFDSAEEYAVYLTLESLDMFRVDMEQGFADTNFQEFEESIDDEECDFDDIDENC